MNVAGSRPPSHVEMSHVDPYPCQEGWGIVTGLKEVCIHCMGHMVTMYISLYSVFSV
jgi:hypothetical protein